jgi:pre-mRNA-processing factor 17
MSLSLSYSSDEESLASVTKDTFGLTALPVAKKHRVENATTISTDAAPDVLAEVPTFPR